jgi:hypothetical protein
MHPVHDIDVVLLMATTLAAKRRPADLIEIIAATDLQSGAVPSEAKLAEAFQRLSSSGLICAVDGAYTLTPQAQKIMTGLRRKTDLQERIFDIKEKLGAYDPPAECPAIALSAAQLSAAILAHRAAAKGPGKNLLLPKPKAANAEGKPGQRQRKPLPSRRRKT